MSRLFQASVKENKQLAKNHYLLTLRPLIKIAKPKPGQFFMLSADNSLDPLLKRPFSLFRWLDKDIQILYRVVGKLTNILKDKKPDDILEIIGPLGNGFPVIKGKALPILIGGGIGSAPLFSLAETIKHKKPIFFIGAKTKKEILYTYALKSIGINPIISTDDGTLGHKGFITDMLKVFLTHHACLPDRQASRITHYCLYACGPKPMLKELTLLSEKFNLKGYIALEENMACGVGACLSCVVNTKNGFKRVCKEGPVFPTEEIIW